MNVNCRTSTLTIWFFLSLQDETLPRKEKRQYKKRKHKTEGGRSTGGVEDSGVRGGAASGLGSGRDNRTSGSGSVVGPGGVHGSGLDPLASSDDESSPIPSHSHSQPSLASDRDDEDNLETEGQFAFRRNRNSSYLPVSLNINSKLFVFNIHI